MEALEELKLLGYDIGLDGDSIEFVFRGTGEPDFEKAQPLIFEIRKNKHRIIEELKNELCQRCSIRPWARLCWGYHADNRLYWGKFCLVCEPHAWVKNPGMLESGQRSRRIFE